MTSTPLFSILWDSVVNAPVVLWFARGWSFDGATKRSRAADSDACRVFPSSHRCVRFLLNRSNGALEPNVRDAPLRDGRPNDVDG
jgi:hypothetical protein